MSIIFNAKSEAKHKQKNLLRVFLQKPKRASSRVMLYSQTKGVKQKYILCISGLVAYRQYIFFTNHSIFFIELIASVYIQLFTM